MRKSLTRTQERKYLKEGGVRCPFCDSNNISGGTLDMGAGATYQDVTCDSCQRAWTDVYELTGIEVKL